MYVCMVIWLYGYMVVYVWLCMYGYVWSIYSEHMFASCCCCCANLFVVGFASEATGKGREPHGLNWFYKSAVICFVLF